MFKLSHSLPYHAESAFGNYQIRHSGSWPEYVCQVSSWEEAFLKAYQTA